MIRKKFAFDVENVYIVYMNKRLNLIGKTFNRLTVVEFAFVDKRHKSYWKCRCECGKEIVVRSDCLKSNHTKSCGCLSKEITSKRLQGNKLAFKHGHSTKTKKSPEYWSWKDMVHRCIYKGYRYYKRYSELGIYEPWLIFTNFLQYLKDNGMYPRPNGLSIHRIDNEQGYFPGNIKWATSKEQANNRRPPKIQSNNTSGFKGVSYNKTARKWVAQIKGTYLGLFPTPELAAQAYKEAAIKTYVSLPM